MKRIGLIRRRRYLVWALSLATSVALLLPATALARYDEAGAGSVADLYATGGLTAEDVHGKTAVNGEYSLPAADVRAVDEAAKPASTPTVVSRPGTAPGSTVAWGEVALAASLGLLGLAGLVTLAMFGSRRGARVAHG